MSSYLCPICGQSVEEGYNCSGCMWYHLKDMREGRVPPGVQDRFYRFEYWRAYRLNEIALEKGEISRPEAERRAAAITREMHDLQERTLAAEAEREKKQAERYAHYLY